MVVALRFNSLPFGWKTIVGSQFLVENWGNFSASNLHEISTISRMQYMKMYLLNGTYQMVVVSRLSSAENIGKLSRIGACQIVVGGRVSPNED